MILADIAAGNTSLADIFFLVAVILFGLATLASLAVTTPERPWWRPLVAAGLACVALGWLVL